MPREAPVTKATRERRSGVMLIGDLSAAETRLGTTVAGERCSASMANRRYMCSYITIPTPRREKQARLRGFAGRRAGLRCGHFYRGPGMDGDVSLDQLAMTKYAV